MRKLAAVLLMLIFALSCVFATDGIVTWTWFENDPDVEFFRYQVDGEDEGKWTVVDWSVNEVSLELDVSEVHTLYLQQSYDGIVWSQSSMTDSEIYEPEEEEPYEEEFSTEEIQAPEEKPAESGDEVVDISGLSGEAIGAAEEPAKYSPLIALDFGVSYMNCLPDSAGPKSAGVFASYSYTFGKVGTFDYGVKANLSLYTTKNLFTDTANTQLYSYLNALAMMTTNVGNCDIYGAIGLDLGFGFVKDNSVYFGIAAEVGVKYHRFKTLSLGLALSDHQYLAPVSKRVNRMDLKLFVTKYF